MVELAVRNAGPDGTGEITARTPTMTDGYLGDPEPITDAQGWVATGDLGWIDDDGWLYVTGRSKDIIIRGGENIAAVHVEQALLRHPDVIEAAVVGLPDPDLGEQVAAAVVLRQGAVVDVTALRAHAEAHLGRYEVPWPVVDPSRAAADQPERQDPAARHTRRLAASHRRESRR